ncbi:MAG: hypothetical protein IKY45_01250, partial [Clostridia bacterium]|nr:hypothetical protein [Clostridia bacterium]
MGMAFIPGEEIQKGNGPVKEAIQTNVSGVFNNPSNNPSSGVQKVEANLTDTVSGVKLDNKNVGTNAANNTVNNWVNGGKETVAEAIKTYTPNTKYVDFQNRVAESQKSINPNYAQDITTYMNQNRIATPENATYVDNLNNQRTDKINSNPNYSQYANDDISRRAAFYSQYGVDPNLDIETEIDKFLNANPVLTAENAPILQQLVNAKNAKISGNTDFEQFRNSNAMLRAMNALNAYRQEGQIRDAYKKQEDAYTGINDLSDDYVQLMKDEAMRFRDENIRKAEADAMEQRRNLIARAPMADLALQEQLSQMGLTRGANNASGYSENARLMNQLNTSNQIEGINKQLSESEIEYNNAYLDAISEAARTGLSQKIDVQKLIAEVGPQAALALINVENNKLNREMEARKFNEGQRQFDLGYGLDSRRTDADIKHIETSDALAQNQFDYQKEADAKNFGLKTVDLFGRVTTPETAEMLGVPVGTETMAAINSAKEIAISLMNAETNRDEATTNKLLNVWEATGKATTEVANYFNVPEGTDFYKYVHDMNIARINASGRKSGSSSGNEKPELPVPNPDIVIDPNAKYYTLEDGSKVNMINAEGGPVSKTGFEDTISK